MRRLWFFIKMIVCLLIIGISSCEKEVNYTPSGPRTPLGQYTGLTTNAYTLLKVSGDNQSDTINSQLSQPLRVQIQDSLGASYPGEQVTFFVTSGGGSLSVTTVITDVNGYAETIWTLGTVIGTQNVTVSANVTNGSPISFTATGIGTSSAPTAYTLLKISGDNQSSTINAQLSTALRVQVKDSLGAPYSGEQVTFAVTNGGGSLSATSVVTDINGYAQTTWTLGSLVGTQNVSASANVPNGSPVTFSAVATSSISTAYALVKISGDNQSSTINSQLSLPLKVQVQNASGGAYSGEQVTFSVTNGGGNLSATTVVTDINGYAETNWTLGSVTGIQNVSVSANVTNGSPVSFTATGTAAANTMTDIRDGNVYATVTIGFQTWMAENLRYNAPGSWMNPANPSIAYGRLYDWATVMNGSASSYANPSGVRGICPQSWHVPSDDEWSQLTGTIGTGTAMCSTIGWNTTNGTNTSGFNILPAGNYLGSYNNLGVLAFFWSSRELSTTDAWYRYISPIGVIRDYNTKMIGYSCRCVKD